MKYYTIEQVADMFGVGKGTIFNRLREKKYPHASQASKKGKWAIPECCVAPKSTCVDGNGGEPSKSSELQEIRDETDLIVAKRDRLLAQQGFDSLVEFIKVRDNFEPAQQKLNSDIDAFRQRIVEVDIKEQKAERIIKSGKELMAIAKACEVIRRWSQERVVMVDAYVDEAKASHDIKGNYFRADHPFPKLPKCPQELWDIFNKDGEAITTPLLGNRSMLEEQSEEGEDESGDN